MKVLLTSLNSKYIHSNLAIRYLFAVGIENLPGLELKEFSINNTDDYIFSEIMSGEYDVVCFSCYVWNIEKTEYLCENLKKAKPEMKIVLGGPEVSYNIREYLEKRPYIDLLIYGEGEGSFYLLTEALATGRLKLSEIRGIAYRNGDRVNVNNPMPLLPFDTIPFPYEVLPTEDDKVVYYESVRGCPYGCSYCMSSIEKSIRERKIAKVEEELKYFIYKQVKQVKFIDRTFNWDEKRALEIISFIINNDNGITNFHFELCAKLITDEFVELVDLARNGLFQFEIGIQTTNALTLKAVNRNEKPEDCLRRIRKLSLLGNTHIHVDLIAGLPFENMESFAISFNNAYQTAADNIQIGFLKLLKGTAIRINEKYYEYTYRKKAPYEFLSNKFISADEVVQLKKIETVLDLYYNRGGFERSLNEMIKKTGMNPFDFYLVFSDFYYYKGCQHVNHSKEELYRIFLEFVNRIERKTGISMEDVIILLKKDMYERLGSKSYRKLFGFEEITDIE